MATLRYSQIRAHPGATMRYIADKDKMISENVHDVYNVLNYMGEPESTERVYSFGHHCSANPELAEKQFALYRQRYFDQKEGGIQGATADSKELLALHFFMSYTEEDNPTEQTMNEIVADVIEHTKLKDFPVFASNHFDKKHKHSHFLVGQYAAEGKPRKLCLHKAEYDDIRRYANRVCVAHGLSIIDLPVLRRDPEYSDWLDRVIAEGKVTVHPEREEHKHATRQKAVTKELYYKWLKDREELNLAEEKRLTAEELRKKRVDEKYFYTLDGKRVYRISGQPKRFYAVGKYDKYGRKRSLLELVVILLATIIENELKYVEQRPQYVDRPIRARKDFKVQEMLDELRVARETNVEKPSDIPERIADIGKQMNALKQEHRRHENSIKKHEAIIEAWATYKRVRASVEGVSDPEPEALAEYKTAYAVLASSQCLTAEAIVKTRSRYEFEKQKQTDYEERLPKLKKQYRDLKRLEGKVSRPLDIVNEIYSLVNDAENFNPAPLDDIIKASEGKRKKATPDEKGKVREYDRFGE